MDSNLTPFFAVAALAVAWGAILLLLVLEWPGAAPLRPFVVRHAQKAAFLVAGGAMAASLYYSEIKDFIPCEFCWYQRIAMYPLAVVLLVGVVTRQRVPARYVVAVAAIGLALSVYHYQLQLFPGQGSKCTVGVACTVKYVEQFGFITIPFMAGAGFLTILLLELAVGRARHFMPTEVEPPRRPSPPA